MARADYICCEVCDGKGLYDGYWDIRDRDDIHFAVLCPECARTHVLKPVLRIENYIAPSEDVDE